MRHVLDHPWTMRVAQLALAGVFVAAAVGKIADPAWFAQQVHNFRLAPAWSENLVAITLPWIELVAAIELLIGRRRRAGALLLFALMAFFTMAVGSAWARGLDFTCGCFGKASASHVGSQKFFENVGLTLLAWVAARDTRG